MQYTGQSYPVTGLQLITFSTAVELYYCRDIHYPSICTELCVRISNGCCTISNLVAYKMCTCYLRMYLKPGMRDSCCFLPHHSSKLHCRPPPKPCSMSHCSSVLVMSAIGNVCSRTQTQNHPLEDHPQPQSVAE